MVLILRWHLVGGKNSHIFTLDPAFGVEGCLGEQDAHDTINASELHESQVTHTPPPSSSPRSGTGLKLGFKRSGQDTRDTRLAEEFHGLYKMDVQSCSHQAHVKLVTAHALRTIAATPGVEHEPVAIEAPPPNAEQPKGKPRQ